MQTLNLTPTANQPRTCVVRIGTDIIKNLGSLHDLTGYSKIFIVTDETVAPLWLDKLTAALPETTANISLPPGEQQKNIETTQKIWTAMHTAGCDRKSLVINLGGGVIGDLGGFAASTYMRGIDFLNIPTTLLAQVDASVGGKTGFNHNGIKNLIGTFDQPIGIMIDPSVLSTQKRREFLSGFAEIIKHGLISDKLFFELVTSKPPQNFSSEELVDIITKSCQIKAAIVSDDVTEIATRKQLNFGHTVGHAIEALSLQTAQPLLHGESISIGMMVEADISRRQRLLTEANVELIKQALISAGLPTKIPDLKSEDIINKMRSDKKNSRGQLNFTLLQSIGSAVYDQHVDESVVREALESVM